MSAPPQDNPTSVAVTLARIEIKMDSVLNSVSDHEQRIRTLESKSWPLPTVAVLVSVASAIVSLVWR